MTPPSIRRRHPVAGWLFRLVGRCLAVWLVGAVVVEIAALGPEAGAGGGQLPDRLRSLVSGEMPADLATAMGVGESRLWRDALLQAGWMSLGVGTLGFGLVLAFGPVIGVVAGRIPRWGLSQLLVALIILAGWLPGWWLMLLGIGWQVGRWRHPGFADAPAAQAGPVWIEPLWHAAQIAGLAALAPTAWYLSQLIDAFRRRAGEPHAIAARMRGLGAGDLFYRHVLRLCLGPFVRGIDAALPLLFGGQILLEWTLRYPGLGRLLVESARADHFTGLLAALLVFATIAIILRSLLEALHHGLDPLAQKSPGPPSRF